MQQQPSEGFPPGDSPSPWPPPAEPWSPEPEKVRRLGPKGLTLLAWLVIVIAIAIQVVAVSLGPAEEVGGEDPVGRMLMRIQGRYMVGAAEATGEGPTLYSQAGAFKTGTVDQRLCFVVLAGELAGAEEARRELGELARLIEQEQLSPEAGGEPLELRDEDAEAMRLLGALYGEPITIEEALRSAAGGGGNVTDAAMVNLDALGDDDRERLIELLGWYGRLALAPRGGKDATARAEALAPAKRTFAVLISVAVAGVLAGLGGFVGLVIAVVLACLRTLRSGVARGPWHHGIYAETFALWFVLFFLLQLAADALGKSVPELAMPAVIVAFFLSLLVLAWPVVRGIPWRQVRTDIGWRAGRLAPVEPLIGLACYAMTLPILAVGVLLTLLLMFVDQALAGPQPVFAPSGGPAHPIIAELGDGSVLLIVQVLILASVAAPIVEETMFRGVLYRHLRDASAGLGFVVSVLLSTLFAAFVFAVIHPQGWVAIPALMSLAVGFTLAREWRGTLVPSMVMHGLSNGLVLGMVTFVASG